jgi:pteridine reductase
VTGAARRIGAAIAEGLHREGMNLVIHYRASADEAEALCRNLNRRRRDSAVTAQADLQAVDGLPSLIKAAGQWGGLDLLINNASSFFPTPVGSTDETAWDDLLASNLKGPFFLCQAAAPVLRERRGQIINLADIHADRPLADHAVYCAAKAGLVMLTRALARDLAPEIRVNAVAPGAILWPESGSTEKKREAVVADIPLGRTGRPADVVAAVRYLARDAGYVTGQVLPVDGGRSLAGI